MRPTWRQCYASAGQRSPSVAKGHNKVLSSPLPYRRTSPSTTSTSKANTAKSTNRAKPLIYAFAISAITIAGTWWGATLKNQWQRREVVSATTDIAQPPEQSAESGSIAAGDKRLEDERRANEARERERRQQIETLLGRRARLVGVKEELERKIEMLRTRKAERERLGLREVGVNDSGKDSSRQ